MAGFTDEEVQEAVDRFLLKQVEVPNTKTGARDVTVLRSRVYDLLTTVFLLRPDAYFYVIYLAKNRLRSLVAQQIELMEYIEGIGPNITRSAKLIDSTTELTNAQAALLSLNAGLNTRSTGIRGSIGPAVDRFRRSVSSFVNTELTKNLLVSNTVTETGEELRSALSTKWGEGTTTHSVITYLAENIRDALSTFDNVSLPESSIGDIVSKIATRLTEIKTLMEGDNALANSRNAMLELLTMRTLLTKASEFRNPELALMPKRGDTALAALIDSDGNEASLLGTVSGPYNYDPSTSLVLSVNSGSLGPFLFLPELSKGSRAELRSKDMSVWVAPTPGDEAAFQVDYTGAASLVVAAYASGPAAAAALDAGLTGIDVLWDAATSQLVFQSANPGDDSQLRALTDTGLRQGFWAWAFPPAEVAVSEAFAEPVEAEDVVQIFATIPEIDAEVLTDSLASFLGERTAVGGEEAIVWDRVDSGSDLAADGSVSVVSPSKNFETLGVVAGMGLHTTAPSVADYTILAVNGAALTLDTAVSAGTLTYYAGTDYRGLDSASRVRVVSGVDRDNTGFYRLAASGAQIARLVLDRDLQSADTELVVTVFLNRLLLTARGTTTTAGIGALVPTAGAIALGFPITAAENTTELTTFELQGSGDLILRGVRAGDLVDLESPSSVVYTDQVLQSLTTTRFVLEEPVGFDTGNWTYAIKSYRAAQYYAFQTSIIAFLASTYVNGFNALDRYISRLIRGARYSSEIEAAVTSYKTALETLQTALDNYAVPRENGIDNAIKTMREQGFDRALDLLLALEIEELFTMDSDGVSYSSWLIRNAATTAREVTPVSKQANSTRILQEWRTVSFQPNPFDPRGEDVDD